MSATGSGWFQNTNPVVTPGRTDIGYNLGYPVDCRDETFFTGDIVNPSFFSACTVDTSIGKVDPRGNIIIDAKDSYRLTDNTGRNFILPIPNGGGYVRTVLASTWGGYIGKYDALSRSDLLKTAYSGLPSYAQYEIQPNPDGQLTDSVGTRVRSSGPPLAFSGNGKWMIVDVPYVGLFKVSTDMNEMVPFAESLEQTAPGMPYYAAISDDGNLVAMAGTSSLTMYGVGNCSQRQFTYGSAISIEGCLSREIWNDHSSVSGITSQITVGSEVGGQIRFVDSDTLRVVSRHRSNSHAQYTYNEYYVTTPGSSLHKLAFLGMGDSYISGEGIGTYQSGTDTSDNKCHLSPKSYPYLIGGSLYDSYESVACSGAKTTDVNGDSNVYGGQTKKKIPLQARDPDKQFILANFLPGYAQQLQFVREYHPKTAIISIGGNDIKFSEMIKSCLFGDTCFSTYQSRKQKAQQVHDSFGKLVGTYKAILSDGTKNLYVVGYPEVAKENGNCGYNVHLDNAEIKFSNLLIHYLNQTVEAAANSAGARYVNVEHAFDSYRLCESTGSNTAVNGLTAGHDALFVIGNESYHPTALGHRLMEQRILDETNDMQAPMPVADESSTPPLVTNDMPLLAGYSQNPDAPKLKSVDDLTDGTLVRGTSITMTVDGLATNTAPNATYNIVLHSTPVILGTLVTDANGSGSATITVPSDTPTGIHTLNLYGNSFGGQPMQVQQYVYVAASKSDVDGDGVLDSQDQCIGVLTSGQDMDEDGIDDACDPIIGDPPLKVSRVTNNSSPTIGLNEPVATTANESPESIEKNASNDSATLLQQPDARQLQTQSSGQLQKSSQHVQGAATTNEAEILSQAAPHQKGAAKHWLGILAGMLILAVFVAALLKKNHGQFSPKQH